MKAIVATYETDEKAVEAIKKLSHHHFPMNEVSLLGKSEVVKDDIHVKSNDKNANVPALVGAGAGTIVGLLSGIGVFTIPGFGFLYGSGAVIGALAGLDFGIIGGGLGTLLMTIGLKEDEVVKYESHLHDGQFLVIVNGSKEDISLAEDILNSHGTHVHMSN
ncbi:hypothetical protein K6119_11120 [Paracrocinitomix mangrovi]|uniref:hypothetical protein n=1 Tax=Paracrocinitomix mangrovi TaxID=2862509 RepID=UPI001C8E81E6|nr:hypothetical protein [Paracrocinitomix mangrovi]UKN00285.1 hypothetical protein K6119_11120 [Paracrocinitomix mangrovi]